MGGGERLEAQVLFPVAVNAIGNVDVFFIVNHDGVVYEKDLSDNTENAALAMKLFNPDDTWKQVETK